VAAATRRPWTFLLAALACCAAALPAALSLGLNTDGQALFAADPSYTAARDDFRRTFPSLYDPILVVVDGGEEDRVREAAEALRLALEADPEHFPGVFQPGGGPFFDQHGWLYLETEELQDLLDRLTDAQPYLATLAVDPSLPGLFGMLDAAVRARARGDMPALELTRILDETAAVAEAATRGESAPLSWNDLLFDEAQGVFGTRRVILVQPVVDFGALEPAGASLAALRTMVHELGLQGSEAGVRVRLTGVHALSQEEAQLVSEDAAVAGVASFLLVSLVLAVGLRSARYVLAMVAALAAGLLVTAAFAALAFGALNLISVAFSVLFIGLSVDFGIHLCVRHRELLGRGVDGLAALAQAGDEVGSSLVLCALTTAIGFYAFLFTDLTGVAELGAIAGTGMWIALAANLTVLPAVLTLLPAAPPSRPRRPGAEASPSWTLRHPRLVLGATVVLALGAGLLLPRVEFDANPLSVRDPAAESVQAFRDLLADGAALPWNVHVLAADSADAARVGARLEELAVVEETITLSDWIPKDQDEKLERLFDAALLLLPSLEGEALPAADDEDPVAATRALEEGLGQLESQSDPELVAAASRLRSALGPLAASPKGLALLASGLLDSWPSQLARLRAGLGAGPVSEQTLPPSLRAQVIAADGRVRVEVVPAEDLDDTEALERYVHAVREAAPDAFGEGIVIYEIARTVVRAFQQALLLAGLGISVVLLLVWRNLRDAALVAGTLGLAALLTAAGTVVMGLPLHFANVIVIPLLLGIGGDSGIHLVYRARAGTLPSHDLLRTTTAQAVLLSAATTAASFGTLGFSSHLGMAGLGQLLALGIAAILLCNLGVLPVLVQAVDRRNP
jgi:hopanoid biosynthesis associated RND transporter like protein HpnN